MINFFEDAFLLEKNVLRFVKAYCGAHVICVKISNSSSFATIGFRTNKLLRKSLLFLLFPFKLNVSYDIVQSFPSSSHTFMRHCACPAPLQPSISVNLIYFFVCLFAILTVIDCRCAVGTHLFFYQTLLSSILLVMKLACASKYVTVY